LTQLSQFSRLSSAFCASSFDPKYSMEHLLPRSSLSQVIAIFPSPSSPAGAGLVRRWTY
jgi:hypothetical protein